MKLIALPALSDNCIWMLHGGRQAVVVDPVDAAPVPATFAASHPTLAAILVTHRKHARSHLRFAQRATCDEPAAVMAVLRQRKSDF